MNDKIIPFPANGYEYLKKKVQKVAKRFLLFCGSDTSPMGGWDDCEGIFPTVSEALEYLKKNIELDEKEWYHIIDLHSFERVHSVNRKTLND